VRKKGHQTLLGPKQMPLLRRLIPVFLALALVAAAPNSFRLSSPAFQSGGAIPPLYTCDGENISPPLSWRDAPPSTRSLALVVDDPDAVHGRWRHWGLYNLSAETDHLGEAISGVDGIYVQTLNDFGKRGYGGPCPPHGSSVHHYRFRLYALDTSLLDLSDPDSVSALERTIEDHTLNVSEMFGLYGG
jgi:Raf kinase inhibitor-like YbhB/YbcL family protein